MKKIATLQRWYRTVSHKHHARHLRQPPYPFAGTVGVLRRMTTRLSNPKVAHTYCENLPTNVFCRVNEQSVTWWILTERMLWMAQVDRHSMDVAFAACVDFDSVQSQANLHMHEAVQALYSARGPVVSWEDRLAALGSLSSQWMQRNHPGNCVPGLFVSKEGIAIAPDGQITRKLGQDSMRTALRLQRPQRLEVAVPQILHGLWAALRQENFGRTGDVADSWQMACALVDNPWESWQTGRSGRLSNTEMQA